MRNIAKTWNILFIARQVQEADQAYERGMDLFEQEDYENARHEVLASLALNPRNSRAYCLLGSSCGMLDDIDIALLAYGMAIQLDPEYAPVPTLHTYI